jgi:hypothetical protein
MKKEYEEYILGRQWENTEADSHVARFVKLYHILIRHSVVWSNRITHHYDRDTIIHIITNKLEMIHLFNEDTRSGIWYSARN